ncbi:MAG: hypothetical protein K0A92_08390 [Methyloprofundus sp.]|nr:hypothetical protein [Methyloprofundus sp.]
MVILDCETYDSAICSISDAYGLTRESVEKSLKSIDLDAEYEKGIVYNSCDNHLKYIFELEFGRVKSSIGKVYWFHLTRTPRTSNFKEGVLPLGQALERIWDALSELLESPDKKEKISIMRNNGVRAFQFNLKAPSSLHHGPYAMLVREAAFNSKKIRNHDKWKTLSNDPSFLDRYRGFKSNCTSLENEYFKNNDAIEMYFH